jgi:hypothetical protein
MELLDDSLKFEKHSLSTFNSAKEMWDFAFNHVKTLRNFELTTWWDAIEETSKLEYIPEDKFVIEYTFSVYASGFKASTIAKKFEALLFYHGITNSYVPGASIGNHRGNYIPITNDTILPAWYQDVFKVFNNRKKAEAIQKLRRLIWSKKYEHFHNEYVITRDPLKLQELPYIGPALGFHLARNLGNTKAVKPDVHLNRLASRYNFDSAEDMCLKIAENEPGLEPGFVDLVLWIASADNGTL